MSVFLAHAAHLLLELSLFAPAFLVVAFATVKSVRRGRRAHPDPKEVP
jgi:hypothetical protein